MQKQNSANQSPSASSGQAADSQLSSDTPDGYLQGMNLDVSAASLSLARADHNPKIDIPTDLPSASVAVKAQANLNYGEFLQFKEAALEGEDFANINLAFSMAEPG